MYTVNGIDEGAARTYMYITSLKVFEDYFPLGPGFGTFGTDSAAKFYSPLNYQYGLNSIRGLNPDDEVVGTSFYSDTFYPLLSQFGVIGVLLFFLFVKKRWVDGTNLENEDIECIKLGCGIKAEITYNVLEIEYNEYYDTPEKDIYYDAKKAWEESQESISSDQVLNKYKDYIYAINKKDDQFKKEHGLKEE